MIRTTSKRKNERKDEQSKDCNDFECREPKFDFSESFDTEVIDEQDDQKEDGNPDSRIDLITINPLRDNESGGSKLIWCDNDVPRE